MAGLTSLGFVIKTLQEIKTELENEAKSLFGSDLDVSEDSIMGQWIGNLSVKFANIWELAQAIYESMNPDRAEGASLDGNAGMVGVIRLPATSTTVVAALYGSIGTVIPIGHLIRQTSTNEDFELIEAVAISLSNVIDIEFSVLNVLDSTLYTVTINGNAYTYTSDATATAEEIIAGLKLDIDSGSEGVTVVDNLDGTARIYSSDGYTPFSISVDANLQIDSQASPGDYEAVNTGNLSVPTNTIIIIVNPISGLDSVDNLVAGLTGSEIETDEELRIRRRELLTGVGAATDEAIRFAVLQEVDGVTTVLVISNRTDSVDGGGRPAHSFETVVSGGDEQEIAEKIWENMPSGIESHGDVTKTVTDSTGRTQTIKFSRPSPIDIYVEVDYTLNTEETFPTNGEETIKENIVEYCEDIFSIGDDVIRQKLTIPIYEVPGIKDITIRLSTSGGGPFLEQNITIAADEVAAWSTTNITVTDVTP
ncbi:MAG: baseplate J/gp47 family protein [Promethearchaeota archaeon]